MLLALSSVRSDYATAHEQKLAVLTILSQSEESFTGLGPIRSECNKEMADIPHKRGGVCVELLC